MYKWTQWLDHVTEHENRYRESSNPDGTVTHTPVPGEIIQQGTPQSARNFNHMEDGISNAGELAALMVINSIHQQQALVDLKGECYTVDLTNSQKYPFNNSVKTVSLNTTRNHMDYTVNVEVVSHSGGFVGDVIVSDKLLNGFKIEHTGSAKAVTLKVYVKGGFY